ncbi:MAG: XTP/dITP diphosphatase [Deltaproteobacteria bacterium]|jgi:XTP/dITP diphosphohydrolase|nr:XTP/dITP diphosphatase [Deltaproteobacteria bacterium]
MKELIVATRNAGKLKEISRLCKEHGIVVLGLERFPELPEIEEDGESFAANAIKKAGFVAKETGLPCLADDSGLVVDALGGRPGIHSARYAGDNADDSANNRKLILAMQNVPDDRRQAAFCCVMAFSRPDSEPLLFEGQISGTILREPRGDGCFGYDPLFFIPEYGLTMAQLPLSKKNRISHRGQALMKVIETLGSLSF